MASAVNKPKREIETTEKEELSRKDKHAQGHEGTLLVKTHPILHIHLHPQTLKSLHLRFHLGRPGHPEHVK